MQLHHLRAYPNTGEDSQKLQPCNSLHSLQSDPTDSIHNCAGQGLLPQPESTASITLGGSPYELCKFQLPRYVKLTSRVS